MGGVMMATEWFQERSEPDGGSAQLLARYVKQQVGEGMEFSNEIARVVVSKSGCYYEFRELPEEFSGVLGNFTHSFVGFQESLQLLEMLYHLPRTPFIEQVNEFSLLVVYDRLEPISYQNVFAYHYERSVFGGHVLEGYRGTMQPQRLPRFFKLRLLAKSAPERLGFACGMAFFIANPGDRHLLVQVPYTQGQSSTGLLEHPLSMQLH